MLYLLAKIATGLGWKGLDDYEPPSERLAEWLAETREDQGRDTRHLDVMRFMAQAGGEAG